MNRIFTSCTILLLMVGRSQGFVNLNFEAANVPDVPVGGGGPPVSVTLGMPGWSFYDGEADIGHNGVSAGGSFVAIEGPSWPSSQILQGNYTAYVQGSTFGTPTSAYIAQTGQIPMNSMSIQLYVDQSGFADFQVTFAGNAIPTTQIGSGPNYYIVGGNVSAYAGQTGNLQFTALPGTGGFLDNIVFSTSPVPEPSNCALILAGAVLFGVCRRRKSLP